MVSKTEVPTSDTAHEVDPITASVLQRRVDSITKEMATMLMRSSRSPIFNEIGDLVTVIFDREGNTLAQAEFAAIIAFGAHPSLEYIIEYFGDDVHDGDVIIHNDVYHGGNQNADTGIYMPVFAEGQLVGWTAAKGHLADIGGMTAGGYNPNARDIWQEALRIPPLKVVDRGVLRKDVWDLLSANIRFDFVMEDIRAMIGCCTVGGRRLVEVMNRYGLADYESHWAYILDSSRRQVEAEVGRWPDGHYHGESFMTSDGVDATKKYKIAVDIEIAGEQIVFDFSKSDDQAPGITNMPAAAAKGAVRIAFLMLMASGGIRIPTNQGLFEPIVTKFRKGSIIDPHFPAATIYGNQLSDEIVEAIMLALADILPDRVSAGWNKYMCTATNGVDPRTGEPFGTFTVFQRTGPGGVQGQDGWDALGFTGTAGQMRAPDPEMLELTTPHFLEYHEYLPDSAGAGEFRGGLGTRSAWRTYGEGQIGVTLADNMAAEGAFPARGLFGGHDSGLNELVIEYPDGTVKNWGSKEIVDLVPGTRIISNAGGGAGYGDPKKRPAEKVLAEVTAGLLSAERAREDYGVAISDGTVDEELTASLRA
ncbi:hydantoinase B/oxoprolinase family protein [Gordonia rubripertincta]|uniref:Hydantoinase B/oxoprolinase family protein n=1 Tax=Gordonia rubripertincta TaxID=36822 RepID=A0AAW4GA31_GORRU|nr:hydantoinase B/oxoprolinase family protein [Gordonia rubripertincta]MBM7280063.1 hydantoinase B/oxoprolinase family protein [Gordonia rubripertincta]